MSAEFIAAMSDSGEMYYTFNHDVTRYVIGEAKNVRSGLADALEQMGYRVLSENPIQARRSAKGSAHSGCSSDIMAYHTTLNVGVKSTGANSTRVTFDYTLKGVYSGFITKGDRNTLTRETEAILAQAMARAALAYCLACGADTAGSSRFCRQCGAPLGAVATAEMEVLRLTSGANASYNSISGGMLFFAIGAALLLFLLLGSNDPVKFAKLVKIISFFSITLGGTGMIMLLFGIARLRQVVRRDIEQDAAPVTPRRGIPEGAGQEGISAPTTSSLAAALPPPSALHSVTEMTTDLLPHEVKRAS
ncbi:MAG: hypothetical protein M3X11_00520 [Acidobacteriota bacterium]|nr:hypothetical protein [Acidobacteriota bacterium]